MNILYFADPNSIHDKKWLEVLVIKSKGRKYILPRKIHASNTKIEGTMQLMYIPDFSIFRFYLTILTAFRIKRIILENKIDLIHILYAEPNALWSLFRRYFSIPIIISCRGTDVLKTIPEFYKKKSVLAYWVSRLYTRAFRLADWVTGTSQQQLDSVIKFSDRDNRISVIRTGVDLNRLFTDTSVNNPLKNEKEFLLFPRYIKPLYNHEFCLRAIELLPYTIKEHYAMVFIGKDSGDAEYQQKLHKLMGTISDVDFIFLPKLEQEQVFELYKRASMVVMTPLSDGSPVSAMEALACGATVILGPGKYDREIFNENVIQLTAWNEHELAEVITRSLPHKKRKVTTEWLTLIDRNAEMEKVWDIYTSVLH